MTANSSVPHSTSCIQTHRRARVCHAGDIGTSPLYVISSTFTEDARPSDEDVVGVISLIVWTITWIVVRPAWAG